MPFNGSGFYSRVHDWTDDRDNGIKIRADRMDQEFDDIASALNEVFFRSGLVPMSGDLTMGANDIKGIASGAAATPSVQFSVDPNTGLFLDGAGALGISANGTKIVEVNTTGVEVTGTLNVSGATTLAGAITASGIVTATAFVSTGQAEGLRLRDSTPYISFYNAAASTLFGSIQHTGTNLVLTNSITSGGFAIVTASGPVTINGSTVWHSGNDGAGSGLDADLLDGVQGSGYATLSSSPVFTGNVTANQQFISTLSTLYLSPGNSALYAFDADKFRPVSASMNLGDSGDPWDVVYANSGVFNGGTVWHSANDGSGSGLDADLLDGIHGSAFGQLAVSNTWTAQQVFSYGETYIKGRAFVYAASPNMELWNEPVSVRYGRMYHDTSSLAIANEVSGGALALVTAGGGALVFNGNTIWHAANDGAGSGLDADLLDGSQGVLYLKGSRTSQLVTDGTAAPSGGSDGDFYFQYS